jgi:hypothetical protein
MMVFAHGAPTPYTGRGGDAAAETAPGRDIVKALVRAHRW